jgi:hypothetical protein
LGSPFQDAVGRALQEPTLIKALSFIALWESERVVQQAKTFFETGKRGPDGQGWDTCFEYCFNQVQEAYVNNEWPTINFTEWEAPHSKNDEWYGVVKLVDVEPIRTKGGDLPAVRCDFSYEGQRIWWVCPVVTKDKMGKPRVQRVGDLLRASYEIGTMRQILSGDNVGMGTLIEVLKQAEKFHAMLRWEVYEEREHVQIARWLPLQCWLPPGERSKKTQLVRVHNEITTRTDFLDLDGNVLMRDVTPEMEPIVEKALMEEYGDIEWRTKFVDGVSGSPMLPNL